MLEIIIFIIIIIAVTQSNKKKGQTRQTPPFMAGQKAPSTAPSSSSHSVQPPKQTPKKSKQRPKEERKLFSPKKGNEKNTVHSSFNETPETRTFVEPSKSYRPAPNAGERYEEWMPVPEGKQVCRCGYCGADNLIPKRSDPKNYSCYFCREEL